MAEMNDELVQVSVPLNQQQLQLNDQLIQEGTFGKTYGEVVRAIFVEWLREEELV